jgi:hypothetical protein
MTCRTMRKSFLSAILVWLLAAAGSSAASYYIHPLAGSDENSGTSLDAPFQSLARLGQVNLGPGDEILLAAGQKFAGQVALEDVHGTAARPILISSYRPQPGMTADRALIDARGFVAGVCLKNCSEIKVENLQITADGGGMQPGQIVKPDLRCGVLVLVTEPGDFSGFTLSNLLVKDIFYEEPGFVRSSAETKTANGTQKYGWGIRFLNRNDQAVVRQVSVVDCEIQNVSHTGLQFSSPVNCLRDVTVSDVRVTASGGPGVQMSGLCAGRFSHLDVNGSGSTNDLRNWKRGSGLWTWGCNDVVIEKSRFQNANGPGDSCGVHIDFNCRNVIVQYNLSAHNAGGFCEILGNDHNCAYRYNVSVNDGYRVKGRAGAFQEGKIFWLSGYTGDKVPRQGPFNTYFYNNTIYVSADIVAKLAVADTAEGVLIANNIFCIEGASQTVTGDQNRADKSETKGLRNVVFKNNLYATLSSWPADASIKDQSPIIGNPEFQHAGGMRLEDYIPQNARLVRHRGIPIPRLRGDEVGLTVGLNPQHDILGNPILGVPDLGAIQLPASAQNAAR